MFKIQFLGSCLSDYGASKATFGTKKTYIQAMLGWCVVLLVSKNRKMRHEAMINYGRRVLQVVLLSNMYICYLMVEIIVFFTNIEMTIINVKTKAHIIMFYVIIQTSFIHLELLISHLLPTRHI
jgi:hypothetical protein